MLIIILGICIVGGVVFFSMWDYWICCPAPVVAMMAGEVDQAGPAVQTGETITQDLSFIESSDFKDYAFNALPGESGNNPTVHMEVGDKVVFNVDNGGITFHAFGVTKNSEGFSGLIPGSEIGSMSNSLKPGESDSSEFIAGEEGIYYYICTIPGHRELGMVGQIIVGDVAVPEAAPEPVVEAAPEPVVEAEPEPVVEAEPEPVVEAEPEPVVEAEPDTSADHAQVSIGTVEESGFSQDCAAGDGCYTPVTVTVNVGDTVIMTNTDTTGIHTFTAGTVDGFTPSPTGEFDTGIINSGESAEWIPETAGEVPYYCMLHTWMTGNITVN
jgi:plastocyanin